MYPVQNYQSYPNQAVYGTPYVQPQVSAVKIDIHNPQAYGGVDESGRLNPAAPSMYNYPYYPMYNMPAMQQYSNPGVSYPQPPLLMPPVQNIAPQVQQNPIVQKQNVTTNATNPVNKTQNATVQTPVMVPVPPVPVVPVVNAIPQPVVSAPVTQQVNVNPQPVNPTDVKPVEAVASVSGDTNIASPVDVKGIISNLTSKNVDDQTAAIQKIAELAQTDPNASKALLNEQVFGSLANLINADTSKLQGPVGKADPKNLSPLEKAEINKQFAIYTLAMLQKNFRDEINKEMKKNNLPDIAINDLPFIKEGIVNNLKDNPNPTIREACLSALNYVGRPEDKEVLRTLYDISAKHDASPNVQKAAADYLAKLPA